MVLATHEMAFARDVATKVCFLDGGRVLERARRSRCWSRPSRSGRGSSCGGCCRDDAGTAAAHGQESYDVRLEWGPTGGAAMARGADIAVVVDVLSFTTTLGIAVARGSRVYPFPWKDDRAVAFAAERDAVLAVGRFEAAGPADPPRLY